MVDIFGDLGEWFGAFATLMAVIVSLRLARKSNKAELKIVQNEDVPDSNYQEWEVLNKGQGTTSVRMYLLYRMGNYKGYSDERASNFTDFKTLGNEVEEYIQCVDENGNHTSYDYYRRYEIRGKHSIQLRIDKDKLYSYLYQRAQVILKKFDYSLDIMVKIQDIDNNHIEKMIQMIDGVSSRQRNKS